MERFLAVLEDQVQIVALSIMTLVYIVRITWLLRLPLARERTPPRGDPNKALLPSMLIIATPWAMESTSRQWWKYGEFVLFHLGVAAAILLSFVIPYGPGLLGVQVVTGLFLGVMALALVAGISRLIKRIALPEMRVISSADDYFSLVLLNAWLASALAALTMDLWPRVVFFILTAFFLIYVPFSKISHYIYYPFARWYFGKHFGRRGVFPKVTGGGAAGR